MKYITPALTALHNAEEIDIESCLKLYDNLIANGIDGVAVFGSSGEFPHLSLVEKKKLVKAAVPHIKGRMQCLVGTGGMDAKECIEFSNYAMDQGADGVMIISPYYFALPDESVFAFYAKVASAINGPIYIYNYPDRTGYSLRSETVLALAQKFPHIAGIKDTVPDMGHTVELIQRIKPVLPSFEIFSGYDNNFAYNILSGGDGCIAALSNIRPELCSAWAIAAKNGDFATLCRMQRVFDKLMAVYGFSTPFMGAMKSILVEKGLFASDILTFPYAAPDSAKKQEITIFLQTLKP